jgi:3-deoxy-D-manno-octulosonic acid kinase
MIARFHRAGVWHADLTAHNILLEVRGVPWLLDFDRGRIRPHRRVARAQSGAPPALAAEDPSGCDEADYPEPQWRWLLAGYAASVA